MEPVTDVTPPVVTVTVVHEPGPWFDEVLDALAEQEYPNLKHLFLVASDPGDLPDRIRQRVPNAFVRAVYGNLGFGPTANEVLSLVQGDNGFFCILHDDVALDPSAVRLMVEELYRSNAGIVGPKLVEWNDPGILQHVGLDVDRFGEVDPIVEVNEVDQEQHDAVRDVFAVPSACMLVRADLFRAIGGFPGAYEYHGEDLDLCWRAHLSGARVIVVPSARGRHRERLVERRDDLAHLKMRAQHRVHTVASLTGGRRLPGVTLQMVALSVGQMVVGLFTGHVRDGWESLKALFGSFGRLASIRAVRRKVAGLRQVPDSEVAGLQVRGSARLRSYLRHRGAQAGDPDATNERRWRESAGSAPAIAWMIVLTAFLAGSRTLIVRGVPPLGEFLPYPHSPRGMIGQYWSGWWADGLGSSSAMPTGYPLIAVGSVLTLFRMGLWHTVAVLGTVVLGYAGIWRLASVFQTPKARIAMLAVYAFMPLPSALLSYGKWTSLAVYAGTPWFIHGLRRVAALESTAAGEREASLAPRRRIRAVAALALVVAVTMAFVPTFALLAAIVTVLIALTALVTESSRRIPLAVLAAGAVAIVGALVLHLPWTSQLFGRAWRASTGVPAIAAEGLGASRVISFDVGDGPIGILGLAMLLPVLVAPVIARGSRLLWAARGASLVLVFMWLAVLSDRGSIGIALPSASVLVVPAAVGVALAAGALVEAFDRDVLGGSFGFRQPLAVLGMAALVVGVVPGALAVFNGRWGMPRQTLQSSLRQLRADPQGEGDYRVLWIGDPRLMPVAAWEYQPGLAYAITDDGPLYADNAWTNGPTSADAEVADVLRIIATQSTLRGGRLLAPYGIRYVVVPVADDAVSPVNKPVQLPDGLTAALEDQLDLGRSLGSPLNYLVYENTAWIPTIAQLTEGAAAASRQAGFSAIAQSDAAGATPLAVGERLPNEFSFEVQAGTVQVATPFNDRWQLNVNGDDVPARPSFGATTAFDVPEAGTATLRYSTPLSRQIMVLLQLVLWGAAGLAASKFSLRRWREARAATSLAPVEALPDLALTAPIVQPEDIRAARPDAASAPAEAPEEPGDIADVLSDDIPWAAPSGRDDV